MKIKKLLTVVTVLLLITSPLLIMSCSDDDSTAEPFVALSESLLQVKAGEEIEVTVSVTAEAGFTSMIIKKLWDGDEQSSESVTTLADNQYVFTYSVIEDDADHVLTFNFEVTDSEERTISTELVVVVELTKAQILVKYDWVHTSSIRIKTSTDEIAAHNADNVYRFNEDGTFQLSMGTAYDSYEDFYHYCYWSVDETTGELIISHSLLNSSWTAYDDHGEVSYDITSLTTSQLDGDITYSGLDVFDPTYDPEEDFTEVWSAQAKGSNFDPYKPGADDDTGREPATCYDIGS